MSFLIFSHLTVIGDDLNAHNSFFTFSSHQSDYLIRSETTGSSTISSSATTPSTSTSATTTTAHTRNVCPLGCNLHFKLECMLLVVTMIVLHTFKGRSCNIDPFNKRALGTKLGSLNSMYANLRN